MEVNKVFGKAPLSSRIFLKLRWSLTPYWEMAERIPPDATVLDLGCGHGLFPMALALQSSKRHVVGVDHDRGRIDQAREASREISNLEFQEGNLHQLEHLPALQRKWSAITLIDVLHYFPLPRQEEILRVVIGALEEDGVLLFREVDPAHGIQSQMNLLHEKVMVGLGVTRAESLHFRTKEAWVKLLQKLGLEIEVRRCGSFPFQDVLFVGKKKRPPSSQVSADPLTQVHWIVADDWGMSPGVNEGILNLARKGIVRGVAVIADAPYVQEGLRELIELSDVQIGLHWVWDEPSNYDLSEFVKKWLKKWGPAKTELLQKAAQKMESQLHALQDLTGRVDFVNGHHHLHVLPGVPKVIAPVLKSFGIRKVRVPRDPRLWMDSKAILNLFSIAARKAFLNAGLRVDPFFYPLDSDWANPDKFRKKLLTLPPSEIIVHPAARDDFEFLGITDPYRSERVQEFHILQKIFLASSVQEPS